MTATPRGRILLVEDDEDSRQFMSVALGVRGYAVDDASSADQALALLHASRYDLVLTDYDMPGKTGAVLLREAEAAGLLNGVPALVVTAHPDPVGVEGLDLMRKPLDIDRFLLQVAKLLEPGRAPRPERPASAREAEPPRLEFALYVSRLSPSSLLARRNLEGLLSKFKAAQVSVEVCELDEHPADAERDRVVFAPTLVKRRPAPPIWVLGDLSDPGPVHDLLAIHGVERC